MDFKVGHYRQASTSCATLVRYFQKVVDAPPLVFLTELRFNLARQRMLAANAPVAVVAEEVGYQSEAAFSRAYHRRFGIAPGVDRRREVAAEGAWRGPHMPRKVGPALRPNAAAGASPAC